jgi:hypothetical protein
MADLVAGKHRHWCWQVKKVKYFQEVQIPGLLERTAPTAIMIIPEVTKGPRLLSTVSRSGRLSPTAPNNDGVDEVPIFLLSIANGKAVGRWTGRHRVDELAGNLFDPVRCR